MPAHSSVVAQVCVASRRMRHGFIQTLQVAFVPKTGGVTFHTVADTSSNWHPDCLLSAGLMDTRVLRDSVMCSVQG
jgi:hypothetical protein